MQLASITFDGEKKVESFIIPLPILEKRLLYSRSNKTIDVNPVSIQPVVETQQMVAEKKDEIRALFLVQKQRPHQVNLKYRLFFI
jgi:hypothetical protein